VVVDSQLPNVLARLQDKLGGALAIISGRPIAFLDQHLGSGRFDSAGLHGLEHRIGNDLYLCQAEDHPALRVIVEGLKEIIRDKPGLLIEDKGCSVALHWRLAAHEKEFCIATAHAALESLGADYRVQFGKAVAEILPSAAGKGKVIEAFLREPPYRGRRPVFIGDDLTDENGFRAVNAAGGISVRIGPGETIAHMQIGTPAELRHSLLTWAEGGSLPFERNI
jgi:trehalose 6-phosphate phosphatase